MVAIVPLRSFAYVVALPTYGAERSLMNVLADFVQLRPAVVLLADMSQTASTSMLATALVTGALPGMI